VPVYRWALPEDAEPLRRALERWARREFDVALFTSATQVEHVMLMGEELGRAAELRAAAGATVIGSIGPVCSEALRAHGLPVDIEPEHPKMGHLVAAVARRARGLAAAKG
jgi:uroporphyrinogen-III synthase